MGFSSYVSSRASVLSQLCSFLSRLCSFLPRLSSFLSRLCSFLPRLCSFLPRLCSFLPRLGSFLPRLGSFLSRLCSFLPRLGSFLYGLLIFLMRLFTFLTQPLGFTKWNFCFASDRVFPSSSAKYALQPSVMATSESSRTRHNADPASLTRSQLVFALSNLARWDILRVLANGEAYMVNDLARRIGRSANATTKHLQALAKVGIVRRRNRLHELVERFRPAADTHEIDFGACVLRLDR